MRTSDAGLMLALVLVGCGVEPQPTAEQREIVATPSSAAHAGDRIDCAVDGAAFDRVCTVERRATATGATLTLRQPDGGFHRLHVANDGRVTVADGAEAAQVASVAGAPDTIEVAIGGVRYRLPR